MTQPTNQNGIGCEKPGCQCDASDETSRRHFLQQASTISFGAMTLTVLPAGLPNEESLPGEDAGNDNRDNPPLFGFLVDGEKCIGAGKCLTACRVENDVPEGYARTWVERYVHYRDGRVEVEPVPETGYGEGTTTANDEDVVKAYFIPKLCNHCRDAPCNQVCPTRASITSPEGVELIDPEICIGCAYCVQACPYGARFINPLTGNADKCTWCYHRIMRDEQPACVEACPTGARVFGRLDDPDSEIRKRIAKLPTSVLKEHLGTHPKLYYISLPGEVI